ncbi:SixA phosphatase family protein [Palleronia caenipelagi]|uniref:Histidine phosphatase family protein n=1 Tax=Palleronia caenipelagi TaxID=2489174 RepID=A0A547Q087_9RHOB|nr:histidine phosphatase family protein [Palleronia caenipelagi]TRD19821.1 histidine phosphatase family protein [Palleronia caenipelagi]
MTLRLILTRHAKSDWSHAGLADHDRPLNERGNVSAPAIGLWQKRHGYLPDTALLSTATRVRETWSLISAELGRTVSERYESGLYHADPDHMLCYLAGETAQTVQMIGHNPGMCELVRQLSATTIPHEAFSRFPTCATLVLDFSADSWTDIRDRSGTVVDFVIPRELV